MLKLVKILLLTLLLSGASALTETHPSFAQNTQIPVDFTRSTWTRAGFALRVDHAIGLFKGKPYLIGPLGEGSQGRFDQDPLYRFDGFDCVTFVETVLSLAASNSSIEFENLIDRIRYRNSHAVFEDRNHFTEVDWIPSFMKEGLGEEYFGEFRKNGVRVDLAVAQIDKERWYAMQPLSVIQLLHGSFAEENALWAELKGLGRGIAVEESRLEYVPYTEMHLPGDPSKLNPAFVKTLPSVSVISLVRPGWDLKKVIGTELNVSHQGLLLRKGNQVWVAHATSDSRKQVVLDSLTHFLPQAGTTRPGVKGFHFLRPKAPAFIQ